MDRGGEINRVRELVRDHHGDRHIAGALGVTRHRARQLIEKVRLSEAQALVAAPSVRISHISHYDAARSALAQAKTLAEVRDIHDKAIAIAEYARRAKDRGLEIDAIEIRVQAARQHGEMIGHIKATIGLSRGGRPSTDKPVPQSEPVSPTLAEIGSDKKFSSYTQKLAATPREEFEARVATWRERELVSTKPVSHDVLRDDPGERRLARRAEMRRLADNPRLLPQGPFAAGVADPPWENPDASIGHTDRHYREHYPTMTPQEVARFVDPSGRHIADIFASTAFLALWITRHHLAIGSHLDVLAHWGFTPTTIVTWDKQVIGLGFGFVRDVTEHIVFAVRGKPAAPETDARPPSLFESRKTSRHSEKPDWPQRQIESWFPDMSYVELFARSDRPKWCAWGNEIEGAGNVRSSMAG